MPRLQTISYDPGIKTEGLVQFCLKQLVCSYFNRNIDVFENPHNPNAIDFYATDDDYKEIQKDLSLLPQAFHEITTCLKSFFFDRGKYVDYRTHIVPVNRHLRPPQEVVYLSKTV